MPASTDTVSARDESDSSVDDDSAYTSADISDHLERARDPSRNRVPEDDDSELANLIREAQSQVAEQYDSVQEFVAHTPIDAIPEDDTINSSFPTMAMARAYVLKLISPEISGYDKLEWRLSRNPDLAEEMGFEPGKIPDHTTFSTQWWERYRPAFRRHLEAEAASAAVRAQELGLEVSDDAHELIERFERSDDEDAEEGDIPERRRIENERRDQVFNEYGDLFHDVLDYDRGPNASIPTEDLNELATFASRRNETVTGGRDVYVREHDVTAEDYMSEETLAKPIRNLSRKLAEDRFSTLEPVPPGEDAHDWSLDATDRDFGEGESWHKRTEAGIEKQVEMLQSRGMLDRPVDICIDGTAREYHKRADTEVEEPPGVNRRYDKFETGYAYEDITVTAIYRGRAIVLASFSYTPDNSHFQAVRYCIDRALDLVNVRNVYADSEFGTRKICSYLVHQGLDYIIAKRQTSKVNDKLEEMEGRADWTDYEIEGGEHTIHKTTLVGLENYTKHADERERREREAEDDDIDDGREQATLTPEDEADIVPEDMNLLSFSDVSPDDDVDYATFVTSLDIDGVGIDPRINPIGHDDSGTAWGIGNLYRKRWSIETAFRDLKRNFKAKPRARCLGVRRFFFMLCQLLYNCWVLLNIVVAHEVEHREDDEIVWRKKTFVIDIYNDVFSDREFG